MRVVSIFPYQTLKPFVHLLVIDNNRSDQPPGVWNPLGLFNYFLATFYILLFLGGVIGNVWAISVILALFRNRSQEPPRNVQLYILVLCVIDIFVLIFMPFTIDDALHGQWTLLPSNVMCKLYLCSELLNKFFAPFILMALSGTCYMVVCRRQCRDFPDDLRAGFTVVTLAVGVLVVLMAPVYVYGGLHYLVVFEPSSGENGTSIIKYLALKCMFQMAKPTNTAGSGGDDSTMAQKHGGEGISDFILYTFVVGYVIPASAFTLFYFLLWRYVRRHSWRARSLVNSWRVARTVLGLISFFLVCWTPFWVMLLYTSTRPQYKPTDRNPITLAFAYVTHLLPYINCLGYPLIYIALNRKIKENYELIRAKRRSQILALCGLRKSNGTTSTGATANSSSSRRESSKRAVEKSESSASQQLHHRHHHREESSNGTTLAVVLRRDPSNATNHHHHAKNNNNTVNDIEELGSTSSCLNRSINGDSVADDTTDTVSRQGSCSVDSQSLFANVNELMELSRHLLIPLIEISDTNVAEAELSPSKGRYHFHHGHNHANNHRVIEDLRL